jgi:hypothetical protein
MEICTLTWNPNINRCTSVDGAPRGSKTQWYQGIKSYSPSRAILWRGLDCHSVPHKERANHPVCDFCRLELRLQTTAVEASRSTLQAPADPTMPTSTWCTSRGSRRRKPRRRGHSTLGVPRSNHEVTQARVQGRASVASRLAGRRGFNSLGAWRGGAGFMAERCGALLGRGQDECDEASAAVATLQRRA